jgi:methionyl-tRNA formyltransferase
MSKIRFAFFGATNYSRELFLYLVDSGHIPVVTFTIPKEFNISYSESKVNNTNYGDLRQISEQLNIPCYEVDSVEGKRMRDYESMVQDLNLDLLLVLGWYYMVPAKIRTLAKHGCWGVHASLLPKYAGGAPLSWAIIKGEKETGVTLFRMEDGVDDGDIISQVAFSIGENDSIADVYLKATETSKRILDEVLNNIDDIQFHPQDKMAIEVFPQRKPEDGEIDLAMPATDLKNFIRAQSSPYPGAYIKTSDGKKLIIDSCHIEEF